MDNTTKTAENQDITELNANQGPVQFENIPQELKDLKQWVLWIGGGARTAPSLPRCPKLLAGTASLRLNPTIPILGAPGENGSVSESDTPKNTNHIKGS